MSRQVADPKAVHTITSVGVKVGMAIGSGKFEIVMKLFRLFIFVCFVSSAVCNPVVLVIVKEPSLIASCFANRVINEVPASIPFGVVMFPILLMYPLVFKSPDAATVKKAH